MTELVLTADEEAMYRRERSLSTDNNGNLILVGLTVEESIWLIEHIRRDTRYRLGARSERSTPDDKRRSQELLEKHERVRMAVVAAEHVLNTERPTRN